MAVRTREEILEGVRARLGEDVSDEAIGFLEDITDTLTDLEARAAGDGEDWKTRYEENDANWRRRYTERFYSPEPEQEETVIDSTEQVDESPKHFEDLFEEVKE